MATHEDQPRFDFFRATPNNMLARTPLASSLQSFETCLFLIGLGLYPSALVLCATAWESALKASLAIGPNERRANLDKMLTAIRSQFEPLRMYEKKDSMSFGAQEIG